MAYNHSNLSVSRNRPIRTGRPLAPPTNSCLRWLRFQSLNQALGHPLATRSFQDSFSLSASPSPEGTRHHEDPSGVQVLHYAAAPDTITNGGSGSGKRKASDNLNDDSQKRVRAEAGDEYDDAALGAKHWSDTDKTKLFQWLMAPENDEHFRSLRSAKNSCLREVRLDGLSLTCIPIIS